MDNMETNKFKKYLSYSSLLICVVMGLMVYFSPYGFKKDNNEKALVAEIDINAPASQLFKYLGNSSTASDWSSFVNTIKPLNHKKVKDGNVGSIRRCFGKEEGVVWDEKIIDLRVNRKRRLSIFNTKGFPLMADNLVTEQVYIPEENGKTKLQLSLFFKEGKRDFFNELKMYFAAYFIHDIFVANLENIKSLNERGQS